MSFRASTVAYTLPCEKRRKKPLHKELPEMQLYLPILSSYTVGTSEAKKM